VRVCDEQEWGLGWIAPEPAFLERCSHAIRIDGRVWLTDAVDLPGAEERVRALGEPAGVIQLIDRHARDCASLAKRLGVEHHEVPFDGVGPFEAIAVARSRVWREVALWWPESRVLVCGDALGTVPYFLASGDTIAVHPLLRIRPPRALAELEPRHVLCGHGTGVHGATAADALRSALSSARRRLPSAWLGAVTAPLRGR